MPAPSSVLVTGDIVIDRHIYEGDRFTLRDQSNRGTHSVEEAGGAAVTQRLIEAVFAADVVERRLRWEADPQRKDPAPEASVCRLGCQVPDGAGGTPLSESLVGTASWSPCPKAESKDLFWRVSKAFGYGSRRDGDAPDSASTTAATELRVGTNLPPSHDVLVLDDAGDKFRNRDQATVWHLPKDSTALPTWIVLKLAGRIGGGDLWDRLRTAPAPDRRGAGALAEARRYSAEPRTLVGAHG